MSDSGDIWGVIGAASAALISSGLTYIVARRPTQQTAQAAEVTAEAAMQDMLNRGFAQLNAQYDARNKELLGHVRALEGAVNGLSQHLYSLEEILREHGHPIPERPVHAQWPPPEFQLITGGKP